MGKGKCLLIFSLLAAMLLAGLCPVARAQDVRRVVLPNLQTIRTDHYRIHTDLDDDLARQTATLLEGMFQEYSRRLADFQQNTTYPTLEVYLFQKKSDYLTLVGNEAANTGGMFCAKKDGSGFLTAFLIGQGRDQFRHTLQHEAFHQFAHYAISPDLPIWLNEGIAQVFQEGIWIGDQFLLPQVPPSRLRQLKGDISSDRLIEFQKFMAITPDQWSRTLSISAADGATEYGQAWAMVHFLIEADNGAFRPRLINLLKLMHEGKDADTAWTTAFSANYAGFQQKFLAWADTLTATPAAVMIDRQYVLGDMVALASEQGVKLGSMQTFKQLLSNNQFRMTYKSPDNPNQKWATDPNVTTYFSNSEGQQLGSHQLYFDHNPSAPLPDVVCRINDKVELRTSFYRLNGKMLHELKMSAVEH